MKKYVLDAFGRIIANNDERMSVRTRIIEILKEEPDVKAEEISSEQATVSAKEALAGIMEDSKVNGPVRTMIAEALGYQIEF